MRRFTSIIFSILLGAVAVGIGMGVFLKKANDDRERLADIASKAAEDTRIAQELSQQAIEQANSKLSAANTEITKAQLTLKLLQEERDLIATATPLTPLRVLKGWREAVNVPLGVSLKFPPGNEIETNDATALTISVASSSSALTVSADRRWLSITPLDERLETELRSSLATSTPASYLVDGHLLFGVQGKLIASPGNIFVLRVQSAGEKTHLIWARDPQGKTDLSTLLTVLATLDFAQ